MDDEEDTDTDVGLDVGIMDMATEQSISNAYPIFGYNALRRGTAETATIIHITADRAFAAGTYQFYGRAYSKMPDPNNPGRIADINYYGYNDMDNNNDFKADGDVDISFTVN